MDKDEMSSRKDNIFEHIVESYIETAEPVGSRALSKKYALGLSPASIRNVMADLEEQGYLKQPHTSAGRIPTDKGYRYYVDCLMSKEELPEKEKQWVRKELAKAKTIEGMADKVSKIISELTENAAIIYIKNLRRVSFLNHLLEELVETEKLMDFFEEEPELFIEGAFRIFDQPEFQNTQKIRSLLQAFDEKYNFFEILAHDLEEEGVHVHIGSENSAGRLGEVSLVVKDCTLGRTPFGGVAVVGPTRMKYAKVVAVVEYLADGMSEAVKGF